MSNDEINEKIKSLEVTLESVVNNEDFDQADKINMEIEDLKKLLE